MTEREIVAAAIDAIIHDNQQGPNVRGLMRIPEYANNLEIFDRAWKQLKGPSYAFEDKGEPICRSCQLNRLQKIHHFLA